LNFLKANLNGQTAFPVDLTWASQHTILEGFASIGAPSFVIREAELGNDLAFLAAQVGYTDAPKAYSQPLPNEGLLAQLYDAKVEATVRAVYRRDYVTFGFSDWRK